MWSQASDGSQGEGQCQTENPDDQFSEKDGDVGGSVWWRRKKQKETVGGGQRRGQQHHTEVNENDGTRQPTEGGQILRVVGYKKGGKIHFRAEPQVQKEKK